MSGKSIVCILNALPDAKITKNNYLELLFLHPLLWTPCVDEISSLKPKSQVSSGIVNFALFHRWFHIKHTSPYYFLPSFVLTNNENLGERFSDSYWSLNLSPTGISPKMKKVFSWFNDKIVIFDFRTGTISQLQTSNTEISWQNTTWLGYWSIIATIFGWDPEPIVSHDNITISGDMASVHITWLNPDI